jgi:flavin reductase (DIM6/NTAB) family NADH-FMN oxidoreductase RutF
VTIHAEHPLADPEPRRDPVRRLRGRLGGAVTLWTTGVDRGRAGLTVSSVLVAPGEPARVLGLVDPDSDLAAAVARTGTVVVQLLHWRHRDLAEAFAGTAPAPGGPFRAADWRQSDWGPVLTDATSWAGVRVSDPGRPTGWSVLLDGVVEHVELDATGSDEPLVHRRGRYLRPEAGR